MNMIVIEQTKVFGATKIWFEVCEVGQKQHQDLNEQRKDYFVGNVRNVAKPDGMVGIPWMWKERER